MAGRPRHPSPKNSLSPKTLTIASLPCWEVTASFTLPCWRYHTESAGSPCTKIVRSAPYSRTVFPRDNPARNAAQLTGWVFSIAGLNVGLPLPLALSTFTEIFVVCVVMTASFLLWVIATSHH